LLKNTNNALPLTGQEKFLAIIGDDAGDNLEGPNGCSDRGCTTGWNTMGTMAMVSRLAYVTSILDLTQPLGMGLGHGKL